MPGDVEIHGRCDVRFAAVSAAFARNFAEGLEAGACVAVMYRGELVVDLWAGHAGERPWERDTLVTVFSATKGVAALAIAMLADRGLLDFGAPVARYWPEFGQAGKSAITVAQLMSHQAGLPAIDETLPEGAALDWERMVHALERQPPLWPPGTAIGYHAVTFSWLAGELVRRMTGRSIGSFVREEIVEPLGIELFIGAPEPVQARIAPVVLPDTPPPASLGGPRSLFARAMALASPPLAPALHSRDFHRLELASTNGCANARALATLYGTLATGGRGLIRSDALTLATAEQSAGVDRVTGLPSRYACGWQLALPGGRYAWSENPRAFGHTGAGGSLGFADPDSQIGFGYAMTKIRGTTAADPRWQRLLAALHQAAAS